MIKGPGGQSACSIHFSSSIKELHLLVIGAGGLKPLRLKMKEWLDGKVGSR